MTTISVIGLGKLGTPMLAVFAGAGFDVVGMDTDMDKVMALASGKVPAGIHEPGVQELIDANIARIMVNPVLRNAVAETDVTFVIVPTPSGPDGGFTLEYLAPVCAEIGKALARKQSYHVVVITSTVMPGQIAECAQRIEFASGSKVCGRDFGLVYSPEFIALGNVIKGLQQPDYVLMGHNNDLRALDIVMGIYRQTAPNVDQVATSWVSAEISKIAQNAFITMKITFANQLGNLCAAIPGANVDDVTFALGHDQRVGVKFLRAGTAYGGPCFPRDNRALIRAGINAGADFGELPALVDKLNGYAADNIADLVYATAPDAKTVGILGLAYKSGTPEVEESASLTAIQTLICDYKVIVYDPLALPKGPRVVHEMVEYAATAAACIAASEVVVIMHPDPALGQDVSQFAGKVVIDPWRVMPQGIEAHCEKYIPLGIGPITQEVKA